MIPTPEPPRTPTPGDDLVDLRNRALFNSHKCGHKDRPLYCGCQVNPATVLYLFGRFDAAARQRDTLAAENERLAAELAETKKELKDYADAAEVEADLGDEARRELAYIQSEVIEYVHDGGEFNWTEAVVLIRAWRSELAALRETHFKSLKLAIETIRGLSDQQAMDDPWYEGPLSILNGRFAAATELDTGREDGK